MVLATRGSSHPSLLQLAPPAAARFPGEAYLLHREARLSCQAFRELQPAGVNPPLGKHEQGVLGSVAPVFGASAFQHGSGPFGVPQKEPIFSCHDWREGTGVERAAVDG